MKEIHNTWWNEQNHKCQVTELMPFTSYITVGIIWTEHTCSEAHCLRNQELCWASRHLSNSSVSEVLMKQAWGPMFHLWDPQERPKAVPHVRETGRDRHRWISVVRWSANAACLGGLQLGETLTQRNKEDNVREAWHQRLTSGLDINIYT